MRRRRNNIHCFKDLTNQWVQDPSRIQSMFLEHFQKIYKSSKTYFPNDLENLLPNKLSSHDNETFCRILDDEESPLTIKQTPSSKSLGLDGFTDIFYKYYWDFVNDDFTRTINFFFINGYRLKELNHTHIVLIPKIESPSTMHQYRPISLSNVCYKMIAKITANRLKNVLHKFISPH